MEVSDKSSTFYECKMHRNVHMAASATRRTRKASIGRFKIEVEEKERVNVPLWAGVAVAIAGGVLLARKR